MEDAAGVGGRRGELGGCARDDEFVDSPRSPGETPSATPIAGPFFHGGVPGTGELGLELGSRLGVAAASVWVLTASLLPLAGLLVLGGRLGDLFGRRRISIVGCVLFAGASALGDWRRSSRYCS